MATKPDWFPDQAERVRKLAKKQRQKRSEANSGVVAKTKPKTETRAQTARRLKDAFRTYYRDKRWAVHEELGLNKGGKLRADMVAHTLSGHFVIGEIKSCVADFKTDSKCDKYVKYANKMYFVMTDKTWAKLEDQVEFPSNVGVMVVNSANVLKVVKKAKKRELAPSFQLRMALRAGYRGGIT